MKNKSLLIDARVSRDVAGVLISGGFVGRAVVELVKSLDKTIAYLESEEEG